jgi:hypothetical protein
MTWAAIIKAVLDFLNGLFLSIRSQKDEELGRLREAQRNAEIDNATIDAVRRADPDSVSDGEAFGSGRQDGNLPRPKP